MGHVIRADVSVFVSGATAGRANSLVQYGDEHGGDERPEQWRIDHRAGGAHQRLRDPAVFCHGRASAAGECLYKGFTYWPIGNALHPQTLRTIALAFSWVLASASLLALPTTFIMLIVQGCFGLLNRIAPPLNLFSLGFPINMLAGLVCFATLLYNLPDHYLHLANFVLQQLDALKGHYGG